MMQSNMIDRYFTKLEKKQNLHFNDKDHMILLTFDDNYVDQSINLMMSVGKYHPDAVSFLCICPRLKPENMEAVLSVNRGVQISMYDYKPVVTSGKWPASAMFRLFAPWLLNDCDRALYMDSDILCTGNLQALFDIEVPYLAMCSELGGNVDALQQSVIRKYLPGRIYCNSGVCIFNLKELRAQYSAGDIIEALKQMEKDLAYPDQDFLNFYYREKIIVLNGCVYDLQPYGYNKFFLRMRLIPNARLIHFSEVKPWSYKCELHLIRLYLQHSQYEPMIARIRKTLGKSHFHSIVRINRPIQRWFYWTFRKR